MTDDTAPFEERAAHEQGFAEVYRNRIQPLIETSREEWVSVRRLGQRVVMVFAGFAMLIGGGVLVFGPDALPTRLMMTVFVAVAVGILATKFYKKIGTDFNEKMAKTIGPILCDFMGVAEFRHDVGPEFIGLDRFRTLRLISGHSTARIQDGLEGEWRGVSYRMAEARLIQRRGRNRQETVAFHGVLMRVQSPKSMPTILFLRETGAMRGWLRERFALPAGMERLAFPDAEVESVFQVYTTDVAAAQAAITPAFGRTLLKLREDHPGARGYLTAAFDGAELLLVFRVSRDFLNLSGYDVDPADFADRCRAALEDLTMPRRVIDTLVGDDQSDGR